MQAAEPVDGEAQRLRVERRLHLLVQPKACAAAARGHAEARLVAAPRCAPGDREVVAVGLHEHVRRPQ
eukprot:6872084-Lingulodinium_polyedra.AAC.1